MLESKRIELFKRLSYLICSTLCRKMTTSRYEECNKCEIQEIINKLAFRELK